VAVVVLSVLAVSAALVTSVPSQAAIAPDASVVAWVAGDDLWIANPDGTGLENLTDSLEVPVWNEGDVDFTPDGRTVVFGTGAGVHVANLATGVVAPLGTVGFGSFGLSPDGDVVGLLKDHSLYTVSLTDGEGPSLVDTDGIAVDRASWSPNGEKIAFDTPCCSDMAVYVVPESGGEPVLISTGDEGQPQHPIWSPDGTRLAYEAIFPSGPESVNNIVVANADGSGGQIGVAPKTTSTDNRNAAWSPDGMSLAFTGTTDFGTTSDVFVAPSDGSSAPTLVSDDASSYHGLPPDPWAPDNTAVGYRAESPDGFAVAAADGAGDPTPLPVPAGDSGQLVWSNDGTQFAVWVYVDSDPVPAGARVDPAISTVYVTASDGSGSATPISTPSGAAVAGPFWSPPPFSFTDVPPTHPFYADIVWMVASGITTGYPDGTFRPSGNVTRASMAAFLYRMAGEPLFTPPAVASFSDVPTTHPFFAEVEWLVDTGITGGYADGTYRPGLTVTRSAMAAFLYRMAGSPQYTPPAVASFPDVATSHIFFAEVEWLVEVGVTGGYPDGTFRPAVNVSRQGMAAFLHRFSDLDV
jgi:dipeptidyl aminopeptidase/acylaminoacyl peptidase